VGSKYSSIALNGDGSFTIGSYLYNDANGTQLVHNGRYFVWNGSVWNYADVTSGEITAIGTKTSAEYQDTKYTTVSYGSTPVACLASRSRYIYGLTGTLNLTVANGDTIYKDIYFETVADDGYYSYGNSADGYHTFSVTSGVVADVTSCS
jgi:hypothetical protein